MRAVRSTRSKSSDRFWMTGARAVVGASLGAGPVAAGDPAQRETRPSRWGVRETARRIEASVQRGGLSVFACLEHKLPAPMPEQAQSSFVIVVESSLGGTPVVMHGDGDASRTDVPLSVVVRPVDGGESEVVLPSGAQAWQALPREVVADLEALQALVADALQ